MPYGNHSQARLSMIGMLFPVCQLPGTKYRFSTRHQLSCPDRRLDHGIHQGHAQAAFSSSIRPSMVQPAGGSDGVFQERRVVSGFKRQLRRAEERLRG